jgi:F-type H+-transporting ATPase subunit a
MNLPVLLFAGTWISEFWESFKEHFMEEIKIGDIGEEINKSILPWKHYFDIGSGFKLLLTDAVIVSWIAIALVLFLLFRMVRKPQLKPGKTQTVLEMIAGLIISTAMDLGMNKKEAEHVAPMIATFAFVIAGCNVISAFEISPPAKNIAFPAALAIVSIIYVLYVSVRFVGLKSLGLYMINPIKIMIPFKILDFIIKPLSLALRLYGNVFGAFVFMKFLSIIVPAFLPGVFGLWFDIGDGILQAVVFSYLTMSYIGEIVEIGHEYKEHPELFEKKKKDKKTNEEAAVAA